MAVLTVAAHVHDDRRLSRHLPHRPGAGRAARADDPDPQPGRARARPPQRRARAARARGARAHRRACTGSREPTVAWGRRSQLAMQLRCLRHAVEHVGFDWLTTISGQDYPARPLEAVERDLAATRFDGFVEGHRVDPPPWTRGRRDEFARRYFCTGAGSGSRAGSAAARSRRRGRCWPCATCRRAPARPSRARTPFRAGDAVPARLGLADAAARRGRGVVRAVRERPGLVAHFARTLMPTEALPHTVLHADRAFSCRATSAATPLGAAGPPTRPSSASATSTRCWPPGPTSRASSTSAGTRPCSPRWTARSVCEPDLPVRTARDRTVRAAKRR